MGFWRGKTLIGAKPKWNKDFEYVLDNLKIKQLYAHAFNVFR